MPRQEPSGQAPDVSVSGSQGVQVGTGNIQNNWMPKPPLDPAVLSGRNPHTAVAQLRQVSHDELVDFFAGAKPGDVSEILEVFSEADLPKLVAILGDISRRRAAELIGAIDSNKFPTGLDDVPVASEEITSKAVSLGWTDAGPLEKCMEGYARKCNNGHVLWSRSSGVVATTGSIDDYYWTTGDDCGFPIKDQETSPKSPYGTPGVRQEFQAGMVYSSMYGVFLIRDVACYENERGSGGWLGFPVSAEWRRREVSREFQPFEGGAIYSDAVDGLEGPRSFAVNEKVIGFIYSAYRLSQRDWRPVSKISPVVSSSRRRRLLQRLEIGLETDTFETAVYWDERNRPAIIAPEIWSYYSELGAEKSWLGFPTERARLRARASLNGSQSFEAGAVYWLPGVNPITVSNEVLNTISRITGTSTGIGNPVSREEPSGADGSGRIQHFENGVVTLRDGKYEVWLRPEPKPESRTKPMGFLRKLLESPGWPPPIEH